MCFFGESMLSSAPGSLLAICQKSEIPALLKTKTGSSTSSSSSSSSSSSGSGSGSGGGSSGGGSAAITPPSKKPNPRLKRGVSWTWGFSSRKNQKNPGAQKIGCCHFQPQNRKRKKLRRLFLKKAWAQPVHWSRNVVVHNMTVSPEVSV